MVVDAEEQDIIQIIKLAAICCLIPDRNVGVGTVQHALSHNLLASLSEAVQLAVGVPVGVYKSRLIHMFVNKDVRNWNKWHNPNGGPQAYTWFPI